MKDDFLELHVLEWSPSQEAFHYTTLGEMLEANWASFWHRENVHSDWRPVGVSRDRHELFALQKKLHATLDAPDNTSPEIPPEEHL
jgi:hypothetical protein